MRPLEGMSKRFFVLLLNLFLVNCIGGGSATTLVVNQTSACTPGHDYYITVQAAIGAADNGDSIIVCPGIYTENVDVDKSLNILSFSGDPSDTVLWAASTAGHVLNVSSNDVSISGFTITGATEAFKAGVLIDNAINANISHNVIKLNYGGIVLLSSNNSVIQNNVIANNLEGVDLILSNGNAVGANNISGNERGVYLYLSRDNLLADNILNQNTYGVYLDTSNNNTIRNSIASDNDRGFQLSSSRNNTLIHNDVVDSQVGFTLMDSSENILDGNQVKSNKNGIFLSSSHRNRMMGNSLDSNDDTGITLSSSEGNLLADNSVNSNQNGIVLIESELNELSGNSINHNREHGILASSSDKNSLIGNTIESNDGGIALSHSNHTKVFDNVVNLNKDGIFVSHSEDNIVANNNVRSNKGTGIGLSNSRGNTIANNTAILNKIGVLLFDANSTHITGNELSFNGQMGLNILNSSANKVARNNASGNPTGIILSGTTGDELVDNEANFNGFSGIYLDASEKASITNNILTGNNISGLILYRSDDNLLLDNEATLNGWMGALLSNSSGNNLTRNNASNNGYLGMFLVSSDQNSMVDNGVESNYYFDILQYLSTGNTFVNNPFNTQTTPVQGVRTYVLEGITPSTHPVPISSNATYHLNVENLGIFPDTFHLTVSNPNNATVHLNVQNVSLDPGQKANFTLTVSGAKPGGYPVALRAVSIYDASIADSVGVWTIVHDETHPDSVIINTQWTNSTFHLSMAKDSVIEDSILTKSGIYNSTVIDSTLTDVVLENALVIKDTIFRGEITIRDITYGPAHPLLINDLLLGYDQRDSDLVGLVQANRTLEFETPSSNLSFNVSAGKDYFAASVAVQRAQIPPSRIPDLGTNETTNVGGYINIEASKNLEAGTSWVFVRVYYNEEQLGNVNESTLKIYLFNETSLSWEVVVDSDVVGDENYVFANATHYSVYGIGASVYGVSGFLTPAPTLVRPGLSVVRITPEMVGDLAVQWELAAKQFIVAAPELAGVFGALDFVPTTVELTTALTKVTVRSVEAQIGDPYEIASERVLDRFNGSDVAVIARGDLAADSIAGVAYARALNAPILLVKPDLVPDSTAEALSRLVVKRVIILGGPEAVSEEVRGQLPRPKRIAGENRQGTAVKIAKALMAVQTVDTIVVTDGLSPDISSVMTASHYRAPILYAMGDSLGPETRKFLEENAFKRVIAIGLKEGAKEELKAIAG